MKKVLSKMYKLQDVNRQVTYKGEEILSVLKEIEFLLISLHKIGSHYSDKDVRSYEEETTKFIDNSLVCSRLAQIRTLLSSKFDLREGEDEMDDVERVCTDIPSWKVPGDFCEDIWVNDIAEGLE